MKGKIIQGTCKIRTKEVSTKLGRVLADRNNLERHKKISKEISKMLG